MSPKPTKSRTSVPGSPEASTGPSSKGLVRCAIRQGPVREFSPDVGGERARLIVVNRDKWVNGTVLRYAFFGAGGTFGSWAGNDALKSQVRKAFKKWADVGIGLKFEEVSDRSNAQIRIGFQVADGHWSYVGRQILEQEPDDRTMNLDPSDAISSGNYGVDVAAHEIGHTLGFPHEHQNPHAGIVWNEEAVYAELGGPPNNWDRSTTFHNIIRKISPDTVQGSSWDPDSVMHYEFRPGLINSPAPYDAQGVHPPGGLSARDQQWVKTFYPPLAAADHESLPLLTSRPLSLNPGQQLNFLLQPTTTRYYEIRTFGLSDTVLVLYERTPSEDLYLTGDDDSGEARNAYIRRRLHAGRTYVLRLRLYYSFSAGETALMWW